MYMLNSPRLDVDAILSFANEFTVIGDISADVAKFILAWTTSRSDYDALVATSFNADFATQHRPVISRASGLHILYTGHSLVEPRGHLISCPRKENGRPHDRRHLLPRHNKKMKVVITCKYKGCGATCEVSSWDVDKSSPLGLKGFVSVPFPPEEVIVQWSLPNLNKSKDAQKGSNKSKDAKKGHNKSKNAPQKGSSTTPKGATPLAPSPNVTDIAVDPMPAPPSQAPHSISMGPRSAGSTSHPVNHALQTPPLPIDQLQTPDRPPAPISQQDAPRPQGEPPHSRHHVHVWGTNVTGVEPALPLRRRIIRPVRSMFSLMEPPPDSPSPSPSPSPTPSSIPRSQRLHVPALTQRSHSAPEHNHTRGESQTGEKRRNETAISGERGSGPSKKAKHKQSSRCFSRLSNRRTDSNSLRA